MKAVRRDPPGDILVVQLRRLGDLVLATPAMRALKLHWPESRVTVLTEAPFHEILTGLPGVDDVLLHPKGALKSAAFGVRLGRRGWDMAFDFHGNPTSARLTAQSGAPVRIGFKLRGRRLAYTIAVPLPAVDPPRYTADMKLDLLRAAGIPAVDAAPRLVIETGERESARAFVKGASVDPDSRFLFVAPAGRRAYKRWPLASFAAVIRAFRAGTGAPVAVIGGPGEEVILEALAGSLSPAIPIVRPESIRQLMACLSLSKLFFGADGGAKQVAQAVGVPTLALFGPQNPAVWTNPAVPNACLGGRRSGCVKRCSALDVPCDCLELVTPEEVTAALLSLWNATS